MNEKLSFEKDITVLVLVIFLKMLHLHFSNTCFVSNLSLQKAKIMGFIGHTCPTLTATEQVKSLGLLTALLATAEEAVATLVSTSEDVATFG